TSLGNAVLHSVRYFTRQRRTSLAVRRTSLGNAELHSVRYFTRQRRTSLRQVLHSATPYFTPKVLHSATPYFTPQALRSQLFTLAVRYATAPLNTAYARSSL
ncbi:MAG: hypothetical protein IJR61_05125, partial [Clostridia bacterium]|nr:hypothetical protein [Clostridia bacterium]